MVNENEERTIASVSADGLSLTLTEPLEFEHISIEQTFGSHTVETRAEVGLLTRNIKIRGSVNADFTEEIEACDEDWHPGILPLYGIHYLHYILYSIYCILRIFSR